MKGPSIVMYDSRLSLGLLRLAAPVCVTEDTRSIG